MQLVLAKQFPPTTHDQKKWLVNAEVPLPKHAPYFIGWLVPQLRHLLRDQEEHIFAGRKQNQGDRLQSEEGISLLSPMAAFVQQV